LSRSLCAEPRVVRPSLLRFLKLICRSLSMKRTCDRANLHCSRLMPSKRIALLPRKGFSMAYMGAMLIERSQVFYCQQSPAISDYFTCAWSKDNALSRCFSTLCTGDSPRDRCACVRARERACACTCAYIHMYI